MTAVALSSRNHVHVAVRRDAALAVATREEPIALAGGEGVEQALSVADVEPRALALQPREQFGMAFQGQRLFTAVGAVAGRRGPIGEPGPAGGSTLQRAAGELISALRVLYELDGSVYLLDYRDAANIDLILGISLTAAGAGETLNVQRSGVIEDSGWSWAPGRVWLGADGALTQTPPTDGYDVLIGAAVASGRLLLNLQDPLELE